jgi:hypothetical protein
MTDTYHQQQDELETVFAAHNGVPLTYRGDGFLELDVRQGRPGAEGAADGALDVAEHGLPEALRAEVAEHHVLEVPEHGTLLLADVVPAQDLHEGVRVPALEQLPLLLEHHVVQLLVRRDDDRVAHQARLEDRAVPKLALEKQRGHISDRKCYTSLAHLPINRAASAQNEVYGYLASRWRTKRGTSKEASGEKNCSVSPTSGRPMEPGGRRPRQRGFLHRCTA